MGTINKHELNTDYLHLSRSEFRYLVMKIGYTENSVSKLLGRNRHYIAQQTRISPLIIEKFKNLIGDTLFFDAYAAVLKRRKEIEELKQARREREAEERRLKFEKTAKRRAKRQARLNRPAL
ncbi:MAG: hypothetical protein KAH48_01180 [Chlorobi bacterium]|nr:hypothetical protein [Chlorobiota bacterium]